VNGVLQIQVCYKNAARVWPKGVWFHVFDSNLRHIQYSTRLVFPCLWHYAPRSEGGCLRPTSKGGLRLTDSEAGVMEYLRKANIEIQVGVLDLSDVGVSQLPSDLSDLVSIRVLSLEHNSKPSRVILISTTSRDQGQHTRLKASSSSSHLSSLPLLRARGGVWAQLRSERR